MLDTPITKEITKLITTGTTEQALLAAVAQLFPNLSPGGAESGGHGRGGETGDQTTLRSERWGRG
jgi:hypothetical protein